MISKEAKAGIMEPFKLHKRDSGSPEVQISILTARVNSLSEHLTKNKKDHATRLGLLKLVGQRRRLLNYLALEDINRYQKVISELKLRK
jgi:small subunit ribosomal protein S15